LENIHVNSWNEHHETDGIIADECKASIPNSYICDADLSALKSRK